MTRPTCETCPFWEVAEEGMKKPEGWCHRFPPSAPKTIRQELDNEGLNEDPLKATFPWTGGDDWCAEHPDVSRPQLSYQEQMNLNKMYEIAMASRAWSQKGQQP